MEWCKCRCEYKELINKGVSGKGSIWNPSNCEYECDKSCDVGEYLNYENCNCKKSLVDKLVEECTETVEKMKLAKITWTELHSTELHSVKNKNKHKCSSCTLCIVLFSILFTVNVGIGTYFAYFHWYLKKDVIHVKSGTHTQTII